MRTKCEQNANKMQAKSEKSQRKCISDTGYRKLSEEYGVNYRVIADRGKKDNRKELHSQITLKTLTKTVEAVSTSLLTEQQVHPNLQLGKVINLRKDRHASKRKCGG